MKIRFVPVKIAFNGVGYIPALEDTGEEMHQF